MGRPLRCQEPGRYYLVTTRCHQARFFLKPDPALNELVLEWLARAQQAFPDLRLHAVCVMSNHLHLLVYDPKAELADWASFFLGNLARAVNRLRERSGTFFERRYAAQPVLDAEALVDRLVYVVTNPVKAGLCAHARAWPGVVLWADQGLALERPVTWLDRAALRQLGERRRDPSTLPRVQGRLRIEPLPATHADAPELAEAIALRERELVAACRAEGRKPLTRAKILAQRWQAAPRAPKRTPQPLCHASDPTLRHAFLESFRAFTARFREASAQLRSGARSARFPDWSFPPGEPLVRPLLASSA